jgi:Phosphotransferase enzyme family
LRSYFSQELVLTVAASADGHRLNLVEAACRRWADEHGIAVPRVRSCAPDGAWLLAEAVTPQSPEGAGYVRAALDIADRVAALPPPGLDVPASGWRGDGGRVDLLVRLARSSLGRLPLHRFVSARRAAAGLTDLTTSHGDFYRRNVLARSATDVAIIDWEFVGPAPRFTDHVRLWSTLRRPADRASAWTRITAGLEPAQAGHLATLTEWMTLRLLAENLAAPRSQRDAADLAHARLVVKEARGLTAALR